MNDFSELENELKKLRPAAVSPQLETRIERALLAPAADATPTAGVLPRPRGRRITWLPLGLGLATVAGLLLLARIDFQSRPYQQTLAALTPAPALGLPRAADQFMPSDMTRVVYEKRDEGLVFTRDSETPARRLRYRTRETMQWQNPGTGASLRVSYPSEEVLLVPISGQ